MADDRIARLEARLLELEAEVAELRAADVAPTVPPAPEAVAVDPAPSDGVGRRRLLRTAVGAAVAGTAVAIGQASPAAANDGNNVVIGATNTQQLTNTTFLNYTSASVPAGGHVLSVQSAEFTTSGTPAAIGAYADGTVTHGVYGRSDATDGVGVFGYSGSATGVGVKAQGTRAAMRMVPQGAAPVGRSDAHEAGEVVVDNGNGMWLCVAPGSPGTWREIASPGGYSALKLNLVPIRAYDSRPDFSPIMAGVTKGKLTAGSPRVVDLDLTGGVVEGATAALVNLTITGTEGSAGFVKLFAPGASTPDASAINWDHASATIANTTMTRLDTSGRCSLVASGPTHALIDVIGYYR